MARASPVFPLSDDGQTRTCVAGDISNRDGVYLGRRRHGTSSNNNNIKRCFCDCDLFSILSNMSTKASLMLLRRTSVLARRGYHATSLQKGGMTPPLPPFKRIPVKTDKVRRGRCWLLFLCVGFLFDCFAPLWCHLSAHTTPLYNNLIFYTVGGRLRRPLGRWCSSGIGSRF